MSERELLVKMAGLLRARRDYEEGRITSDIFPWERWSRDADDYIKRVRLLTKPLRRRT